MTNHLAPLVSRGVQNHNDTPLLVDDDIISFPLCEVFSQKIRGSAAETCRDLSQ